MSTGCRGSLVNLEGTPIKLLPILKVGYDNKLYKTNDVLGKLSDYYKIMVA